VNIASNGDWQALAGAALRLAQWEWVTVRAVDSVDNAGLMSVLCGRGG
jgi:hypothetical protein